jgi:hypothetical protein
LLLDVFKKRLANVLEVNSPIRFLQQDASTGLVISVWVNETLMFLATNLADALKDGHGVLEVVNVRYRNNQFDVGAGIVADSDAIV